MRQARFLIGCSSYFTDCQAQDRTVAASNIPLNFAASDAAEVVQYCLRTAVVPC